MCYVLFFFSFLFFFSYSHRVQMSPSNLEKTWPVVVSKPILKPGQVLVLKFVAMGELQRSTRENTVKLLIISMMHLQFFLQLYPKWYCCTFLFRAVVTKIIYNLLTRKTWSACLGSGILQLRNWGLGQLSNFLRGNPCQNWELEFFHNLVNRIY